MAPLRPLILASLAVFLLAAVASVAVAAVRALAFWRALRDVRRQFDAALAETLDGLEATERRLASVGAHAASAEHARARLARSLVEARVLARAAAEAWALVARLRAFLP